MRIASGTGDDNGAGDEWKRETAKSVHNVSNKLGENASAGCFPAGTLIATPNGAVDIALVKVGQSVLAVEAGRDLLRTRRILKVCRLSKRRLWEIRFDDGSRLLTTASHSLHVDRTWKQVRDIDTGDCVLALSDNGQLVTRQVSHSSATPSSEEVFNLIVEDRCTVVAAGIVAHSFSRCRLLRCLLWTLYVAVCRCVCAMLRAYSDQGRHLRLPLIAANLSVRS